MHFSDTALLLLVARLPTPACLLMATCLPSSVQVRYWKTNLELVKSLSAHKEAVRQLSFAPGDLKYATGSDDSTIRVRPPALRCLPSSSVVAQRLHRAVSAHLVFLSFCLSQ